MADSRNGVGNLNDSRLFEVTIRMWRYGRGQRRRVTVAEAELQRKAAISDARKRADDTVKQASQGGARGRLLLETGPGRG